MHSTRAYCLATGDWCEAKAESRVSGTDCWGEGSADGNSVKLLVSVGWLGCVDRTLREILVQNLVLGCSI